MRSIVHDKNLLNDQLSWSFLTDKANYKPLNQRFRFWTMRPMYAKDGEYLPPSYATLFWPMTLGILLFRLGWEIGSWEAKDTLLHKSTVVDFESEE